MEVAGEKHAKTAVEKRMETDRGDHMEAAVENLALRSGKPMVRQVTEPGKKKGSPPKSCTICRSGSASRRAHSIILRKADGCLFGRHTGRKSPETAAGSMQSALSP